MKTVMKFLLAVTFLATIQAYHLGYYQPHVVYPQFYQTYPAVFARPIMGQPIENHQRNICKNNNGQVVPCYKSFAENRDTEKMDQSGIKSVINLFKSMHEKIQENTKLSAFTRPVNPVFYSISEDEDFVKQFLKTACKNIGVLAKANAKLADIWDGIEVDKLFGQSEEDLVFRKITGIDELLAKDYGNKHRSVAKLIEDTCANPTSEKISSISAEFSAEDAITSGGETDIKVEEYAVSVCGWEISQDIYDIRYTNGYGPSYTNIWINNNNMAKIPYFQKVIQDMQENSKDRRCANRVTKYLDGSIDLLNKWKEI